MLKGKKVNISGRPIFSDGIFLKQAIAALLFKSKKERRKITMNEKFSSVFAVVVFVVLLVFLVVKGAEAFCVHNFSDTPIAVTQTSGHKYLEGYQGNLYPGQSGCYHWSNKGCNKKGGRTDTVSFTVERDFWSETKDICVNAEIPACSDLDITGSNGNYRCVTHGMETCN